jgi:hypothetical protein
MFYRGTVEVLCDALADQLVDAPGGSRYMGAQAPAAIDDLVHAVLALPESDARAAVMRAALTKHLGDARAAGADATQALKSVFTLACTSPFLVSVGF